MKYNPDAPLNGGTRVWLETRHSVTSYPPTPYTDSND